MYNTADAIRTYKEHFSAIELIKKIDYHFMFVKFSFSCKQVDCRSIIGQKWGAYTTD